MYDESDEDDENDDDVYEGTGRKFAEVLREMFLFQENSEPVAGGIDFKYYRSIFHQRIYKNAFRTIVTNGASSETQWT